MAIELLMPALSPTMEEGTLAKWLVKEGDTISSGDVIAEIETDKATMEFEAVDEGVIGKILVAEGTEGVKVNAAIAILLEEGEDASAMDNMGAAPAPATAEAAPAEASKAEASAATPAPAAPVAASGERIFASPLARRIAAQKGLDLATMSGSGPKGRIVKADVENATAAPKAEAPKAAATSEAAPAKAAPTGPTADMVAKMYADRAYEEIKLDGMRKTIAARLTEAKQTIPHFYLRRDIKLDALLKFRAELNHQLTGKGVKLSVNDFIIKAVANALQEVPEANAVWAGDRVLQMKSSDVAVAVAIEGGLFTPVLRDSDMKSLSTLSKEMKDLAHRARDRKLAPHEYQGGSFAISNLGMFGIDNFDAIVNPPHAGILAVGAGVKKPVVGDDGELTVATVMSVTMSVDHRVIDGALGANLLKAIVDNLENPVAMLA
ncbi:MULTISPECIES: pyruvate dehydrogenase complex dihydrolipoamide acetyltransferase [Roseobacteraceae]|uniref:Acetyltransferase component of pyruvate dehydrogenase complex n=1 Tax=Celeribacter baekdonensis B30 TaxID=1208323 RepID=K2JCI4_9RHOB|nr:MULTISPECIES: pyruvate dehydrogenase complex dihydrolipoamide acetyltransferase [Roseobacteraceae]EKE72733.1 branched-chain alpha-keto acid dehydrogenase subunit E2 [Celeribacter baekdonensis B30]KAB6717996.1 pyruvate dehydrogenase complex dihydrolipoamide acetyltransferase [Roseobacter sp. TSBP12]|tara:strand:- start:2210 stop:3514 length:1305 start_codon:yes stop_codon:yes gene_type:complete